MHSYIHTTLYIIVDIDNMHALFAPRTHWSHGLRHGELHFVTIMTSLFAHVPPLQPDESLLMPPIGRDLIGCSLVSIELLIYTDFISFQELARLADARLFPTICSHPDHVLRYLLYCSKTTICFRGLTASLFHPRTLGTLFHDLFSEHYCQATSSQHLSRISSFLLLI